MNPPTTNANHKYWVRKHRQGIGWWTWCPLHMRDHWALSWDYAMKVVNIHLRDRNHDHLH